MAGFLLVAVVAAGCSVLPDAETRGPRKVLLVNGAMSSDQVAAREHVRILASFGGEYPSPRMQSLLSQVIDRLRASDDAPSLPYRVTILNSPSVNAFALPTGQLYVTRGLLALASDTSEIAAVLAHEMAHVAARHAYERAEMALSSALVSRVAADVLNDPQSVALVRARSKLSLASFSRAQELEADAISVRMLAQANYDPYAASRFLTSLGRYSVWRSGIEPSAALGLFSSHPQTPERVSRALSAARELTAPGSGHRDRASFLAALAGITFGDENLHGVMKEGRFWHAKLGVSFTAPAGFSFEARPQDVLAINREGTQAIRLDRMDALDGVMPEAFMTSGWIDGLEARDVTATTINSLPAATAIAYGQEWVFRLGAMKINDAYYRLIMASRQGDPNADQVFKDVFASLSRLDSREVAFVKPARLSLATSSSRETARHFAERHGISGDLFDAFLTLNGLEASSRLEAGQVYKTIVR